MWVSKDTLSLQCYQIANAAAFFPVWNSQLCKIALQTAIPFFFCWILNEAGKILNVYIFTTHLSDLMKKPTTSGPTCGGGKKRYKEIKCKWDFLFEYVHLYLVKQQKKKISGKVANKMF